MSNELIPADSQAALVAIEKAASEYGLMALEGRNEMEKTYILATGMAMMKELLTPQVMKPIMALQGSTLGFRTDMDSKGGYDEKTVRDVTAEALLRGFRMVGNEVNIIAGRFYGAKDGCARRVIEWPGLTEFDLQMAYPRDEGGKCLVDCIARWKLNGVEDCLEKHGKMAISIRRNSGMIDDAILGKAERKMYAAVLSKLSKFVMPEADVDAEGMTIQRPSKTSRSSLNDYAETPKEPQKPAYYPAEQHQLVEEWKQNIDQCQSLVDVGAKQREAAQSGTLSPESLSAVNAYANQRRRQLR